MAKVVLKNTGRMQFEATETHDVVCRARNECKCTTKRKIGINGKAYPDQFPRSFRLAPGEELELDSEVLRLSTVQAALKEVPPRLKLKEE